ncbi:MAG TPA: hypothetical protein VIN67_01125 [Desulfobaccales bacterium]
MLKKMLSLCLVLTFVAVCAAQAQKTEVITGTIRNITPAVVNGKAEIQLILAGRPETFQMNTTEAVNFGLMKAETVSSGAEFGRMLDDLDQARGWKVKLTCVPTGNSQGPQYLVKSLEKLAGK